MTIYKITNKLNQKIYVGQTSQPLEKRFLQHSVARTPLGQAMRDCGVESFVIEVIEECKTYEQTKRQECFWIKVLNCKVPNGYNQSDGGEGTFLHELKRATGNNIKIGSSLKRFRKAFKLTQEKVAEAVGISRTLYTKYECDKNMPSVDTIMKIAMVFGVPMDYLVGFSDDPHPPKLDAKTLALVRMMQETFQVNNTATA